MDDDLRAQLPPALLTEQAAALWRINEDTLYRLAREGHAPVEPIRLGRALRWPRDAVLATLGLDPPR